MTSRLNPYIHMRNTAREALDFYKSVFGGEVQVMPFGDMAHDPADRDLVMHGQLDTPSGFTLMISDTPADMDHKPVAGVTISLSGDDDAELYTPGTTPHVPWRARFLAIDRWM